MPRPLALRRALAPALIAVALILACTSPGSASAATYDVTSCNPDGSTAGWSSYGSSVQWKVACPYNGDLNNRGLGVASSVNVGLIGYSGGGFVFRAPAGTSLAGIGAGVRVQRWDANYWLGLITASGQNLYGYWANDASGANAGAYTPRGWWGLNHESDVHLEVGCSGRCDTAWMAPGGFRAWAQLYDPVTLRIEDDNAPTESVTGGSLLAGAYATGTQALTFNATDASGIRATRLYVDGTKLRDDIRSCDFEQPVPCSNLSGGSYSVDTTGISDGTHVVKVETVDSAGNAAAQSRTITVDNRAPAAPNVSVTGGEGWRNSNNFAVSWTNPSGQVAPIVKARYQLCRTEPPADCQPAGAQSGSNISSLAGLSVPSEGDYTLTVWLEDAAGNTSVANASAPVHLRYDATAPARVSDLRVAGGEEWRSTNAFDLTWTNAGGQLAPVTSAHYRLCDSSGNCTDGTRSGSADLTSISGVSVPGPGAYTLTLWVGDGAGNSDSAMASAPVNLRFDDTDPGQAEPESHDGWLNAADVAHGYDVTVRDSVSPPSGIAGFAVTVDGSDPDTLPNLGPDGVLHLADVPEGALTVKARAVSNSGVASASVGSTVLHVDKTAPELSASGAPDPDTWQPRAVMIGLRSADDLSGTEAGQITYSVDGGPVETVDGASADVTVSDDGEHTVTYSARDAAGNTSAERSISFKLDTTRPHEPSVADPGRWLNAAEADGYEQLVVLDHLPLSGVAGYSFTTDGSSPDDTVESAGGRLKLGSLPEGTTVMKVRAVSGSGLASEEAAAVHLKVDRTAPDVSLRSAPDPDGWERQDVHLEIGSTDELSGMDSGHLEYSVDDADDVVVAGNSTQLEVNGDGRHTVRYRAVDAAGNRSEEKVGTFRIDGEKPGLAVPASGDGWITDAGPFAERIALGDGELSPISGLAGFSVTTDGSTPDDMVDVGPDGVLNLADLTDGITVVKARAVSGSGVASDAVGSGTIRVDRTAPVVALERPAGGNVVARVTDATSGVASAELQMRLDGGDQWLRVPAALQGDRLVGRLDLDRLAAGSYSLRASATDQAGNETVVSRLEDGEPATLMVDPPAPPAPVTQPLGGAPVQPAAPPVQSVTAAPPVRCTAHGKKTKPVKRSHRRHRRVRHRRHARNSCPVTRHKGGEKRRHRHLGGKTHKPARRTAG